MFSPEAGRQMTQLQAPAYAFVAEASEIDLYATTQ